MQEKIFNIKNYWRNIDKQILVSFSILFILGVFFSFSSTSFLADERLNKNYYFFFQKHLIYACASFLIMIIISTLNTDLINRSLIPIFIFFVLLLLLVPFLGVEVKGAKRWLNFYIFRFQPIEFVKPFFILVVAQIISSSKIKSLNLSHIISFIFLSIITLLLLIQPDVGQTILLAASWVSLIFVSGFSIVFLTLIFFFLIVLFFLLLYLFLMKQHVPAFLLFLK